MKRKVLSILCIILMLGCYIGFDYVIAYEENNTYKETEQIEENRGNVNEEKNIKTQEENTEDTTKELEEKSKNEVQEFNGNSQGVNQNQNDDENLQEQNNTQGLDGNLQDANKNPGTDGNLNGSDNKDPESDKNLQDPDKNQGDGENSQVPDKSQGADENLQAPDNEQGSDKEQNAEEAQPQEQTEDIDLVKTLPTPVKTINNGTYVICIASDNSKVLEIFGGEKQNGANAQIWRENKLDHQKFKVTYLNDGYYSIISVNSSKALDVAEGGTSNGTNVWQYEYNGTDAQRWIIQDVGNGYYNIISKCNGLYLDIANAATSDGTNVQVYEGNGTNAQKFKFIKAEEFSGSQTIKDGIYNITSALSSSKVIEIQGLSNNNCANLQLWSKNNKNNQKFLITYKGNGYYEIENIYSGKVLDVANGAVGNGTNVWQYDSNGTNAQKWVIKDAGDGYYYIISRCGGLYLDIANADTSNGTNIQIYDGNKTNAQKFKFQEADFNIGRTLADGMYVIATQLNISKVLDIDQASKNSGANLQIWDRVNVKQQKFIITYLNNGYYKIENVNSNKVLDVANGSNSNGTNVWQYDFNNTKAQQWIIQDAGDGYYYIVSKCGGLYLDIANAATSNGTNVQIYEGNGTAAQRFKFIKSGADGIDVSQYNGTINWKEVKDSNIDFAFVRLGYRGYETGKMVQDSKFEENIQGCLKNNIDCGVYFVTQATNYSEGIEEANYVLERIRKYKIVCPVVIDVEDSSGDPGRADNLTVDERTQAIKGFCDTIRNNGYAPMIYASKNWLINAMDLSQLSNVHIWLAHYVDNAPYEFSDYKGRYLYWQYTSSGSIGGITGNVDLNKGY